MWITVTSHPAWSLQFDLVIMHQDLVCGSFYNTMDNKIYGTCGGGRFFFPLGQTSTSILSPLGEFTSCKSNLGKQKCFQGKFSERLSSDLAVFSTPVMPFMWVIVCNLTFDIKTRHSWCGLMFVSLEMFWDQIKHTYIQHSSLNRHYWLGALLTFIIFKCVLHIIKQWTKRVSCLPSCREQN